jgi:hypothetical protein
MSLNGTLRSKRRERHGGMESPGVQADHVDRRRHRREQLHPGRHRLRLKQFGGSVSFNYDIARSTLLNQRYVGLLQRAVLRRPVRVPVFQLSQHEPVPVAEGPPLQHVVHAGRRRVVLKLLRSIRRVDILRFKAA